MVAQVADEIPKGDPFLVLLFQLPRDTSNHTLLQERFFSDKAFWQPHLARLFLWTRPLATSKTETPDGAPALALLTAFTEFEDILYQVGQDIAEELELPAFAVSLTFLDQAEQDELQEAPRPW